MAEQLHVDRPDVGHAAVGGSALVGGGDVKGGHGRAAGIAAELGQRVGAGAHEVVDAAVEGGVMGVPRGTAGAPTWRGEKDSSR